MCLCPQWSLVSPPFALGNLTRALRENGFEVKQYDINMMGSLWLRKNGYKQIGEGKWGIIEPWTTKNFFGSFLSLYFPLVSLVSRMSWFQKLP